MSKIGGKRIFLLLITCLVVIGTLTWYAAMLDNRLNDEIKKNLKGVSEQNALTIQTEIKSQETSLEELAERIGDVESLDIAKAVDILKDVCSRYSFKRLGISLPDGQAYTTDENEMNISDRDYFKNSMGGQSGISERLKDYVGGGDIIVFSTPIYINDTVEAVLFATYSVDSLQEILDVSTKEDGGISCIVRRDGSLLVGPGVTITDGKTGNVYDYFMADDKRNEPSIEYMKKIFEENNSGTVYFYSGAGSYMQCTPLDINDWYLLNLIPVSAMNGTKEYVMNITYLLSCAIFIMFAFAVIHMVRVEKEKSKELQSVLYVDTITGAGSYRKFEEETTSTLKKNEGKAAIVMMDIEGFKLINELYGYEKGNETLKYISSVWEQWLKQGEIFARRVSDHYVALVFYDDMESLQSRIGLFTEKLQREYPEEKTGYIIKPKFGIYLIKNNSENFQTIQNYAIIAHSMAKKTVGVQSMVYDGKFKEEMLRSKLLEDQMEQAYKNDEFISYYQPKYDAKTQKIVGAEALIRWRKPDGTLVTPYVFIHAAEKSGFIRTLDEYVFTSVCKQQKAWMDEGHKLIPISVNLSREHLQDITFIERYRQIREENAIPEFSIELEITESAMFENQEEFKSIMAKLHELNFNILMDDFGTGYSSLTMLKTVPIDVMKLDKSFVDDYDEPRGEKVITSVIKLAKLMNISVTAEGVETKEQYEFLKDMECDTIQGYYFARPMPPGELAQILYLDE